MLKNYLKILFRDLKRNKSYTFINVGGLAVGFACCILIALYVRSELAHDDAYKYADQLVILGYNFPNFGKSVSTQYPLAEALEMDMPDVESAVITLWPGDGEVSVDGKEYFEEKGVFHAGDDFFSMLSFRFIYGSPQSALNEPNTVVISKIMADKYFPDANPVGQIIHAKYRGKARSYKITGVAKSRPTSYFDFNAVLSLSTLDYAETYADAWGASMFNTLALLRKGSDIDKFNQQLLAFSKRHLGDRRKAYFFAKGLSNFYLSDLSRSDGFHGQWLYLYLFGSVALFILLLACVNYINLSTARAAKRAREVGVRKTVGSTRWQLMWQFLGESILICAAAYIIGIVLSSLMLPAFNNLFGMNLAFSDAGFIWFLILAGISLLVGFLAGIYPAFYLSLFQPARVLKGGVGQGRSGSLLRKGLVTVQFVVAAALIIGTIVVFRQLQFTQEKDLGFEGEQVVVTGIPGNEGKAFKREILGAEGVISATVTNGIPGAFGITLGLKPQRVSSDTKADTSQIIKFHPAEVDYDYIETLNMKMTAGRQFSKERTSDNEHAYIINETAAKAMGWKPEEAVGKAFGLGKSGKVIGVVKDFHIYSFKRPIGPVVLQLYDADSWSVSKQIAIQLAPGAIQEGLRNIEKIHAQFSDEPFLYSFLNDNFAQMYQSDRRLGEVFGVFAVIAIILACMGIYGLSTFAAEQRTKEIGIRKVMGATVSNIVGLLSKDFLKLALLGFIIAIPIAWYGMSQWLQDFVYRINIGADIFILAGVLALFIALATVSWQSVRAALANPVDSLRSE